MCHDSDTWRSSLLEILNLDATELQDLDLHVVVGTMTQITEVCYSRCRTIV